MDQQTTSTTGVIKHHDQPLTILQAAQGLKIMHLPSEDHKEAAIKDALRYVFRLIGLRQLPTDKEAKTLVEFIMKEWRTLTPEEIKTAFHLYAKQELDDLPELYQNFNTIYFSRILQSYKRAKQKEIGRKRGTAPPEEKPATEDEKLAIRKEYLEKCLIEPYGQRNKAPEILSSTLMYKTLEDIGIIKLTREEKDQIMKNAQAHYAHRLKHAGSLAEARTNSRTVKQIMKDGISKDQEQDIKDLARKLALTKWINEQKDQGTTTEALREAVMQAMHLHHSRPRDNEGEAAQGDLRTDPGGGSQETAEAGRDNTNKEMPT